MSTEHYPSTMSIQFMGVLVSFASTGPTNYTVQTPDKPWKTFPSFEEARDYIAKEKAE